MLEAYLLSVIVSLGVFGAKLKASKARAKELGYKFNDLKNLSIFRRGLARVCEIIFILVEMIIWCAIPVLNIGFLARTMLNWESEINDKLESFESVGVIIPPETVMPKLGSEHKPTVRVITSDTCKPTVRLITPYGCEPTAYAYEPVQTPSEGIQEQGIQKVRK